MRMVPQEKEDRRRRPKKNWRLKERREKEDSWADLKIQAVSSGEGSAKSLGKLSPLPVPARKGVVTARGRREAAVYIPPNSIEKFIH